METQNQDAAHSPAEVPNDPGKMFVGGLSWQTSPGKSLKDVCGEGASRAPCLRGRGGVGHLAVSDMLKCIGNIDLSHRQHVENKQ